MCAKLFMTAPNLGIVLKFRHYKQRRESTTAFERRNISKMIQKVSRKLVRKYNDAKVEADLKAFADLGRLDNISQYSKPIKEPSDKVGADDFVKILQKVYGSDDSELLVDVHFYSVRQSLIHMSTWK